MTTAATDEPHDYTWRVTNRQGSVTVEMGDEMAGTSVQVVYLGMGRALIKLGQQFLESIPRGDDDD